ncbi:ATP-binding protein [Ramlibacter sp. XY19]|uniref:AAA family ATPase n=1 Tax=Ramlibacter paludis TaxID=2908000 RepID=UPI0023D9B7C7|nr:AAA family ATPase [Ramlibacter paludis]MCG2592166.1 ATP-binding protein [Ramlibacter paludis]
MDDATIASLREAYRLTPDNHALLAVLLGAYLERGEARSGYELLAGREALPAFGAPERLLAGRTCLAAGEPEAALRWCQDAEPQAMLLKAKALAQLGRADEGLHAYQRAVAGNAALEDHEFLAQLESMRLIEKAGGRPKRVTVLANDDTRREDAQHALEPVAGRVTFADVGGLDELKEQIRRKIILPFLKPSLFQRFRQKSGGGILMYGPPGCGKTLMARATAGECNAAFHNVMIADVLDMYIGESERKLQAIFQKARQSAPCVLFFDEIEALGGRRQHSRDGASAKVVSQFLAEMDGFAQANGGVLVIGATNVPWAVDSAFRRPGRFDRIQFVPPPDRVARRSILEMLLRERPAEAIDVDFLVDRTAGFSGADLRNLVETAVEEAIEASIAQEREVPLTDANLRTALKRVKPTTLEWLTTARNYARYANEAGQYDDVLAFLAKNGKE